MKLYVTDVTEGVREMLDNTLDYIVRESYIEYAAEYHAPSPSTRSWGIGVSQDSLLGIIGI